MNWVIGDLHGQLKMFDLLLKRIADLDTDPTFHFVGDYVDRGPESKQVVDLLLTLPKAHFIRGNHDEVFVQVISQQVPLQEALSGLLGMYFQGMAETLTSYGVTPEQHKIFKRAALHAYSMFEPDELQTLNDFRNSVPESHREFFEKMPYVNEQDDFFTVHAHYRRSMAQPPSEMAKIKAVKEDMLWGRFYPLEVSGETQWKKRGYFGHTPMFYYGRDPEPWRDYQIVLLDTGAAFPQGRLTAYCNELDHFVQASPDEVVSGVMAVFT